MQTASLAEQYELVFGLVLGQVRQSQSPPPQAQRVVP